MMNPAAIEWAQARLRPPARMAGMLYGDVATVCLQATVGYEDVNDADALGSARTGFESNQRG